MSNFDNSNRLSLWLNDKRESATHPHLRGSGETDQPVWANAWFSKDLPPEDQRALIDMVKRHNATSKKPFLSVTIKAKDEQGKSAEKEAPPPEFDDDIPF